MKNFVCGVVAFSLAAGLLADEDYSSYVTLNASDSSSKQSYASVGNWSDKLAPHPDTNYYVAANRSLYKYHSTTPDVNLWKGGKLVVAGTFQINVSDTSDYAPIVTNLTLLGGSKLSVDCYGPFHSTGANTTRVYLASTRANPVQMEQYYALSFTGSGYARNHNLGAVMAGSADSALVYTRRLQGCDHGFYMTVPDYTFATYPGTFVVRGTNTIVKHKDSGTLSMPQGALAVEDGAHLELAYGSYKSAYAHATFQNFTVSNAVVQFAYYGKCTYPILDVQRSLQLQDGAQLLITGASPSVAALPGAVPGEANARVVQLAHVTGTAATALTASSLAEGDCLLQPGFNLPDFIPRTFDIVSNADGSKDVYAAYANLVTMTNDNTETTSGANIQYGACEAGHAGDWSNLETPSADSTRHYVALKRLCCFKNIDLPNATLTYAASGSVKGGTRVRVKKLAFLSGVSFGLWNGKVTRTFTAEDICLVSNSTSMVTFFPFGNVTFVLDGPMRGAVPVKFTNDSDGNGATVLAGDNAGLSREVRLVAAPEKTTGVITPGNMTVTPCRDTSLGGPYAGATPWRAIELADWAHLSVTNDVTLNQTDRGIFVTNAAWMTVASGKTLTIGSPLTLAGELVKRGAGTLALGGPARFWDGQAETAPAAGTNRLTVAAGALKILATNACDGVEVAFADGAKLVLAANADEATAAYGLYDVKWSTPLVLPTGGKLAVAFEDASITAPCTRAICTVTTAAETALGLSAGSFTVTRPAGCKTPKVTRRVNAESDTVTYLATAVPGSTAILLR